MKMNKTVSILITSTLLLVALCCACSTSVSPATRSEGLWTDGTAPTAQPVLKMPQYRSLSTGIAAVTGSKTITRYNEEGNRIYSFTVQTNFLYSGSTAEATTSSYRYHIYDNRWTFRSGSTHTSRNTAYATGVFGYGWSTQTVHLKIDCSSDGETSLSQQNTSTHLT